MTWYKFLAHGAVGPFSGHRWPPPGGPHEPGEWVTATDGLEPCRSGLHLCRSADLPFWVHEELYVVDVDGPVAEYDSFVLARRARLVHRVSWDRRAADAFSRACAWRVRDLAAAALERTGRYTEAHRLLGCTTLEDLDQTIGPLAREEGESAAGYVADAVSFAEGVAGSGWASATATTAFVAAAAARATARGDTGRASWAAERQRQASWIAGLAER